MSNIVRHDPYALDDMLDDLFKGYWVRPMRMPSDVEAMGRIRMDVKESENAFTVHAELPGVKKEDIHVTLEGGALSITAEVRKVAEEKEGDKVLRSERYHGRVSRRIMLGQDVDESRSSAHFENGVLELVLPKKVVAGSRKLAIE